MAGEAGLKYCYYLKKKDLIDLILGKRESGVEMTHFVLVDMTIMNSSVFTKRELQEKQHQGARAVWIQSSEKGYGLLWSECAQTYQGNQEQSNDHWRYWVQMWKGVKLLSLKSEWQVLDRNLTGIWAGTWQGLKRDLTGTWEVLDKDLSKCLQITYPDVNWLTMNLGNQYLNSRSLQLRKRLNKKDFGWVDTTCPAQQKGERSKEAKIEWRWLYGSQCEK